MQLHYNKFEMGEGLRSFFPSTIVTRHKIKKRGKAQKGLSQSCLLSGGVCLTWGQGVDVYTWHVSVVLLLLPHRKLFASHSCANWNKLTKTKLNEKYAPKALRGWGWHSVRGDWPQQGTKFATIPPVPPLNFSGFSGTTAKTLFLLSAPRQLFLVSV